MFKTFLSFWHALGSNFLMIELSSLFSTPPAALVLYTWAIAVIHNGHIDPSLIGGALSVKRHEHDNYPAISYMDIIEVRVMNSYRHKIIDKI